jgi:hypothetical protein
VTRPLLRPLAHQWGSQRVCLRSLRELVTPYDDALLRGRRPELGLGDWLHLNGLARVGL